MRRIAVIGCLLALSGCMGPGKSGAQPLKPWTWFSHQEASATDRAERKVDAAATAVDTAREDLLKAAQRETHRASLALAEAPESRPVSVASDATTNATAALDQALGPLSAEDSKALRDRVTALLSEVAAVRQAAEQAQERDTAALMDAGRKLEAAESKLAERERILREKQDELRSAFDRENALANKLRGQRWALVGIGLLGAVGYALMLYMRITRGGLLSTIVGRIDAFRKKRGDSDPAVADLLGELSSKMSAWEKKLVRKTKVTAAP